MTIITFNSEEEMEEHAEMIGEINFELVNLKQAVCDAEKELACAEVELNEFIENNSEYLL